MFPVILLACCFVLVMTGMDTVLDAFKGWAPQGLVEAVASISFLTHFDAISKGVIDLRDLIFFGTMIAFWLFANAVAIDARKAE